MTTLAIASALPALFAVATLSLTKPSDYCYVNITATNSLEGTGIGATAPADGEDTPLRYEDVAFFAEAYAERVAIFDKRSLGDLTSGQRSTVVTNVYSNPNSISKNHATCFRNGGKTPTGTSSTDLATTQLALYTPIFLDPSLTPISEVTVASHVKNYYGDAYTTPNPGIAWCDIFGADSPFAAVSNPLDATALEEDTPIKSSTINSLYSNLAKLTRPAIYDDHVRTPAKEDNARKLDSHYTRKEYDSKYNPDGTTTNVTTKNSAQGLPYAEIDLFASYRKTRSFTVSYTGTVTPGKVEEVKGYDEITEVDFINTSSGDVYINLYPAFQNLLNFADNTGNMRLANAVKAFVLGTVAYSTSNSPNLGVENRRYFVMPISVNFAAGGDMPFLMNCNIGGEDFAKGLLDTARSLFSDMPSATSGADLLSEIGIPEDPSADEPYDDVLSSGTRQNVIAKRTALCVYLDRILVYFDMQFHARANEGGE